MLESIDRAFHGVALGDGVSLHETVVIDNYGTLEQRQAARQGDEQLDWRRLVGNPDFARICGVGGLSFYDAAGLRFHLPVYLSLAVTDFEQVEASNILESLMFHLTDLSEYQMSRLSILNARQRGCIHDVLIFLREEYELNDPKLDNAISSYWNST